jgi:hypothetical protein
MANFCINCGSPAVDNQKFCNKCGAQIGATGERSAPASTLAVTAAPPASATQPPTPATKTPGGAVAAPEKKGSSAVKIIIGIVACLAVVSVLGIGSCFYIGYKIKQKAMSIAESSRVTTASSSTPELHLSEGGAGSRAAASATVDVPPYPNSTPTESGGELSAGPAGAASAQEYQTSDAVDKVESFYKDKFDSKITLVENEGKVMFNYLSSQGMTTVTITRDASAGKTKINIARIGK